MSEKLQLDLNVLLPQVPDERDDCVDRLSEYLRSMEAVDHVHVVPANGHEPAKVCIHYDGDRLSLSRIRQAAEHAGAHLTDRYGHVLWAVRGITHQRRARTVAARLRQYTGVLESDATASGLVRAEFDRHQTSEDELKTILGRLGVQVIEKRPHAWKTGDTQPDEPHVHARGRESEHAHDPGGEGLFGERTEIIFAVLAGVCVVAGWVIETFTGSPDWVSMAFFVGAYFFGGWFTLIEAIDSIRVGRFEIDFLMLVAAAGAAVLGAWFEGGFLLFLFSLGHSLEHHALGKARHAIESLADLAPDTAIIRRGGDEREIPVERLEVGDLVIVRPNERMPADGFVVEGSSAVNQAPVTGESVPVDKSPVQDREEALTKSESLDPSHRVFAGTINGNSVLEIVVTKRSAESALARVVEMVTEAETQQSPSQRFADRFERVFVPAVLVMTVILLFAWVVIDESFSDSFYRAMAVLVASSPCALAIATPSAVLSAVARAGRGGVLVKGGRPLENLGDVIAIAFDKTGTLTEGKPRVTHVVAHDGASEEELIETVVAVEKVSDHPIAAAVVRYAKEELQYKSNEQASDVQSITGRGVRARLNGDEVFIGKDELFGEVGGDPVPEDLRQLVEKLQNDGRTTMIVRRANRYLGILALMDVPREEAREVVSRLRAIGVDRMVVISGDNERVTRTVADQVGLDEAHGDLMPDDKVATIERLRRSGHVAMIGDGVNDAPAMARASVGIAMGAAGSDVAMETADIALMADDLGHLPFAVDLSRRTGRIIKQNLWLSLGMVAILIPATLFGLQIGPAVALHEGSTLLVVINALRLLRD